MIKRLLHNARGSAAVEFALFAPMALLLTLGVADLGTGMYMRMTINATTQAGAIYAVFNSGASPATCATLTTSCSDNIKAAMNDASGDSSFCTSHATCTPSIAPCSDDTTTTCVTVTADVPFSPLLPVTSLLYMATPWGASGTITATSTIRVL
jgi:Flp pilus assembly protein TadG